MLPPPAPPNVDFEPLEPFALPAGAARLWLVRHGEVEPGAGTRAYGASDVPLSPHGLDQTRALGQAFRSEPTQRVLASPLERARRLGEAIAAGTGCDLTLEPRLRELDRGAWQGLPRAEYRARWSAQAELYWSDPWHWRGHGGESDAQLCARAGAAFEEAAAAGGTTVLACHAQVIRVLIAKALGLPAARSYAVRMQTGHAGLLRATPLGWTLACSNVPGPGHTATTH